MVSNMIDFYFHFYFPNHSNYIKIRQIIDVNEIFLPEFLLAPINFRKFDYSLFIRFIDNLAWIVDELNYHFMVIHLTSSIP